MIYLHIYYCHIVFAYVGLHCATYFTCITSLICVSHLTPFMQAVLSYNNAAENCGRYQRSCAKSYGGTILTCCPRTLRKRTAKAPTCRHARLDCADVTAARTSFFGRHGHQRVAVAACVAVVAVAAVVAPAVVAVPPTASATMAGRVRGALVAAGRLRQHEMSTVDPLIKQRRHFSMCARLATPEFDSAAVGAVVA